ncbi:glycosyl hydrolase family 28-related protein [Haloferula sp.]|uniref:glycosyl hydrolase family 28-related protein n=1 Tax=Haloferula sp. TaxID=2497595 RepID=UPI003C791AA8
MTSFSHTLFLTLAALMAMNLTVPGATKWKVVTPTYPTTDVVVVGCNVLDFGAKPDGRTDCTGPFQKALDQMAADGGGTVFAPKGRYVFRGNLVVPRSVTLRGEWKAPTADDRSVEGTILMPYAGKGNSEGTSFIRVGVSGGVKDLSIWYPEQSADDPTPYPFCLEQIGMDNATFENLTLVNPYLGIRIGPQGNELHYIHRFYGTPLKTGIRYDSTTDIGRLEQIAFSPFYWSQSGLPDSPSASERFATWLKSNATGIHMLRSDWEYVDGVRITGYQTGFRVTEGERGAANAQFRRLIIRDCVTALSVEKTNPYGMVFTECYFGGSEHGVLLGSEFDSVVMFSNCILASKDAIESQGSGVVLMGQCRIDAGDIGLNRGSLSLVGSTLKHPGSRILVGKDVTGVVIADCTFADGRNPVVNQADESVVQMSGRPIPLVEIPEYPKRTDREFKPAGPGFQVISPGKRGDETPRIQQALNAIAAGGGGTVFLSGGDYRIEGNLNVPTGVELRGIHDVPHHTMGGGSILHVYPKNDRPTVTLEPRSGLRGLSFHHPEQSMDDVREDPFLIQGRGADIHIINVNASNPYQYLDFMTHRCDNHYVNYLSGAPLKTGIAIGGGCLSGEVRNTQFNPHYARRPPPRNPLFNPGKFGDRLWAFQKENLDAIIVADCTDQFLHQNFVFGSLYGIRFTKQKGAGPTNCISHGHGTDGSKVGVFFEHGSERITMINSELVAMSSENKTAIKLGEDFEAVAILVNTMVWGTPDLVAEVAGGVLALQNLTATRHGEGLLVGEGKLHGTNLNFLERKAVNLQTRKVQAEATLTGIVVRRALKGPSSSGKIKFDFVIERP